MGKVRRHVATIVDSHWEMNVIGLRHLDHRFLSSTLLGVQRAKPFAGVRGVPEKLLFLFSAEVGESTRMARGQIPSPRIKCRGEGLNRW